MQKNQFFKLNKLNDLLLILFKKIFDLFLNILKIPF